ncbi:transcriptional regulator [Sphingobium sufflavum]|uniref:transcriptional regulator n=1 Tax=Sphingobium sufflavum TaxID=1129547 RepID=UPI001F1B06F8|nr:transcriptional regulator [Sphingobium sufflavum]MCE7797244.1 transcriptional regulator [Sphingobium sufflavum]
MSKSDDIIHQATRLKIMSVLNVLAQGEAIEFVKLKQITQTTDGNLGAHIEVLANAKYLTVSKRLKPRPTTRVRLTAAGRRAFEGHVAYLREILDGATA